MELELGHVRKPIRQLRKSLKGLSSNPPMQDVHDLRTRTRHVEALVAAFMPGKKKRKRRLLKTLKPLLKAAGEVRDMDVLAAKAHTLNGRGNDSSVTRLLEHLDAMRIESACELVETVARQRRDVCRSLKRFSKQIEDDLQGKNSSAAADEPHAAATKLMDELSRWPAFNAVNLHAFRIKVKELRNVLRLAGDANLHFVHALEKVKDQIGDWHDWQQLKELAKKVLDCPKNQAALAKIEEIEGAKFKLALGATYAMRSRYLCGYTGVGIGEPERTADAMVAERPRVRPHVDGFHLSIGKPAMQRARSHVPLTQRYQTLKR